MVTVPVSWVIVAGGFHDLGAMDRANAALAKYLLDRGARVHLVGHEIEDPLRRDPSAVCHKVPRPKSAAPLAESMLSRKGLTVAAEVIATDPGARVVVNGGNCSWPDINWVHAVHACWHVHDEGAPAWLRVKHRAVKAIARRQERAALRIARTVVANSKTTRRAVIETGLADPSKVHAVYLGTDPSWGETAAIERAAARTAFRIPDGDRVVAFVGALGFDLNKGFDVVWTAWEQLATGGDFRGTLLVAGGGGRLPFWRREAARAGIGHRVRFLGHTARVREVLAAADLLVSPVHYEAYGMNVHEALCRGAAVMVSGAAGIVERFDNSFEDALLPPDITGDQLTARLRAWSADVDGWRARAASVADTLRARSWEDMAAEIVALVARGPSAAAPAAGVKAV
jgi:glycosyltransferase involved in cell wall biosynthesis